MTSGQFFLQFGLQVGNHLSLALNSVFKLQFQENRKTQNIGLVSNAFKSANFFLSNSCLEFL
jgi:hypothetical protein